MCWLETPSCSTGLVSKLVSFHLAQVTCPRLFDVATTSGLPDDSMWDEWVGGLSKSTDHSGLELIKGQREGAE